MSNDATRSPGSRRLISRYAIDAITSSTELSVATSGSVLVIIHSCRSGAAPDVASSGRTTEYPRSMAPTDPRTTAMFVDTPQSTIVDTPRFRSVASRLVPNHMPTPE